MARTPKATPTAQTVTDAADATTLADVTAEIVAMAAVITAPSGPRRRIGRRFGPAPVRIPVGELSADEMAQLEADPKLKVTYDLLSEAETAASVAASQVN